MVCNVIPHLVRASPYLALPYAPAWSEGLAQESIPYTVCLTNISFQQRPTMSIEPSRMLHTREGDTVPAVHQRDQ